jgi:hypothetical protein
MGLFSEKVRTPLNLTTVEIVDHVCKGLAYSALPTLVQANARHVLLQGTNTRRPIELLPHQLITNRIVCFGPFVAFASTLTRALGFQPVEPGAPPKFTLREDRLPGTTVSWRQWAEQREVEEWIQSVGGVLDQGWNDRFSTLFLFDILLSLTLIRFQSGSLTTGSSI